MIVVRTRKIINITFIIFQWYFGIRAIKGADIFQTEIKYVNFNQR